MDRTLNFVNDYWVKKTMPYNVTQTHSIFVKTLKKYLCRHPKGKNMINFYVINALVQNLAKSEFCPILRLL